jgi:hypothetical protein
VEKSAKRRLAAMWQQNDDQVATQILFLNLEYFASIKLNSNRIFLEHKQYKHLWKFSRNLETHEQMNSSHLLRLHGFKLFSTIDKSIGLLETQMLSIPAIMHDLGYYHFKQGVRNEHFKVEF